MKLIVLAGGFGTRLSNVIKNVPKPLAPIGDTPFLYYQVQNWISQGVRSFIFLLHHQAELINHFIEIHRNSLFLGCSVESIIESQPLDTGGAIANAIKYFSLEGMVLVTNADTWLGAGVRELSKFGEDSIAVIRHSDVSRYGYVEVDFNDYVLSFHEKTESNIKAGKINAGMCLINVEHFNFWREGRLSLERDIFPQILINHQLRAITLESHFIDIGIPEDYFRFCEWQQSGRKDKL